MAFDLSSSAFFANPYPTYQRMREQAPVFWCEPWQAWVLTRHADVTALLRQPTVFGNSGRVARTLDALPEPARSQVDVLRAHFSVGITHSDPPDHTRLRALLQKSFTPAMINALRPSIEVHADAVVRAAIDAAQGGVFDVMEHVFHPLPIDVIANLIGAPDADRAQLRRWATDVNTLHAQVARADPVTVLASQTGLVEFRNYIHDLIRDHRAHPRNDLLGLLLAAREQNEALSEQELISVCVTLFVAGHETSTHSAGNGLLALLAHPDQLAALRDAPGRMPAAYEEMLRFNPSVQRIARRTLQDGVIAGQPIAAGQMVLGMVGAANRDPAVFAAPDRFDIARADVGRQLGFGHGIRFCLGAPLARIEVPAMLSALLRHCPRLVLVRTPIWRQDVVLHGVDKLWIREQ